MPHSEGMAEQPQVKILDKALRVLMLFTPEQPEWGVSALSREVGNVKEHDSSDPARARAACVRDAER